MSITHADADALDRADMERLAAGHDAALNPLMERHGPGIFQFLCRALNNEADAEDLAQETFVRVYRARARFRSAERFKTWLYTIAANLARSQFRWRSRHPSIPLETQAGEGPSRAATMSAAGSSPADQVLREELGALVRDAVGRLPEELREALVLCEWEECSMAEAAVILNTTPKAIESRLYRARKILREKLKSWL